MGVTYPRQAAWSPGRFGGLAAVAVLHAGIVYVLVTGLGQCVIDMVRPPLDARIIVEAKPLPPPPEPAKPLPKTAPPPKPYVPPPVVRAVTPVPAAITAVTTTRPPEPVTATGTAPLSPAPAPVAEPVRVAAALDVSGSCRPPHYPPLSRRNGETGAVVLRFLIDTDGTVLDSKVESSSGFERLDEAALNGLALCHFTPGSVDGRPERSWARMRYIWKLN